MKTNQFFAVFEKIPQLPNGDDPEVIVLAFKNFGAEGDFLQFAILVL